MSLIDPGPWPTLSKPWEAPTFFINGVPAALQTLRSLPGGYLTPPGPWPTFSGLWHSHNHFIDNIPTGLHEIGVGNDAIALPLINPGPWPTFSDVFFSLNFFTNDINNATIIPPIGT